MKDDVKSIFVLFIVALISGLILALTYSSTKDTINQTMLNEKHEAILQVIHQVTPEQHLTLEEKGDVFIFKDRDGALKYIASIGKASGYSSNLSVAVGFNSNGIMTGIKIVSEQETPGLGANSEKPEFYGQFAGKNPLHIKVVKQGATGDEIMAITGATITSKAVTRAVRNAYNKVQKYLRK